jgi:two-component system C4-dicarboxylate transport response regulator DctD
MPGPDPDTQIVVLVEDDPAVLASLRFAFELEGFLVFAHESAESLLAAGPPPRPACFVIDQRLPGMDGLSLVRRLREYDSTVRALLITTSNTDIARRAAGERVPIVDKPLVTETLVAEVRRALA